MTDDQLLDVVLSRAAKVGKNINSEYKNPKIVLTQQYGKKIYFALKFDNSSLPLFLAFARNGTKQVFILPELPSRLMDWKRDTIKKLMNTLGMSSYIDFDIHAAPKEVVHIFFSAIISTLNTPGMSIGLMFTTNEDIFGPDETYEEVQIEADLMGFKNDSCW